MSIMNRKDQEEAEESEEVGTFKREEISDEEV